MQYGRQVEQGGGRGSLRRLQSHASEEELMDGRSGFLGRVSSFSFLFIDIHISYAARMTLAATGCILQAGTALRTSLSPMQWRKCAKTRWQSYSNMPTV